MFTVIILPGFAMFLISCALSSAMEYLEVIAVLIFQLSGVVEQVFPILRLYSIESV